MPEEQFRLIDLIDDLAAGKDVFFKLVNRVKDPCPAHSHR